MKTKFSYTWNHKELQNKYLSFDSGINIEINSDYFIGAKKVVEILEEFFPKNFLHQSLDNSVIEEKLIKGVDSVFQKLESPSGFLEIIMKIQLYFLNCTYTKSSETKDYITR